MSEVVERWEQTAELFSHRLEAVREDQWELPTPCSEWNVRQLVDHAVDAQARYSGMLGVSPATQDWSDIRPAISAQFALPAMLEMSVEVPRLGPLSASQIVEICVNDLLIHTWDLARSIGADEMIPEPLAAACLSWLQAISEQGLRAGRYADIKPSGDGAAMQAQMLALAGRET